MKNLNDSSKKWLFSASFLCFCAVLNAQSIASSVIAADGGHIITPDMTIDWTIGETFTDAYLVNAGRMTEGFHQPMLKVENGVEAAFEATERSISTQNGAFSMLCWPNPVTQSLFFRVNAENWTTTTVQLLNENGQLMEQSVQNTNLDVEISMRNYPNGQYFLQFLNPVNQLMGTKKITLIH